MRWQEILNESVKTYAPMFTGLFNGELPEDVAGTIRVYEQTFRRKDRVMWALRWYRIDVMDREQTEMLNKFLSKMTNETLSSSRLSQEMAMFFRNNLAQWKHYFDLPIEEIQSYIFDKQLPSEILRDFADLEAQWKEGASQRIKLDGSEHVLIDFHNGWKWYDLKRPGCTIEAGAMGHCGNGAGRKGETVLSLRRDVGGGLVRPSLTFILDQDGFLGEMKGRENNKPAQKYHDMIEALLRLPMVKGIKGGGYLAGRNFSLDDMAPAKRAELEAFNPHLGSLRSWVIKLDRMKRENADPQVLEETLIKVVEKSLDSHGFDWAGIEKLRGHNVIVIRKFKNIVDYNAAAPWAYVADKFDDLTMDLEEIIERVMSEDGSSDIDRAAEFAEEFKSEYQIDLMDKLINRENRALSGMEVEVLPDGRIWEVLGIAEYAQLADRIDSYDDTDEDADPEAREVAEMSQLWSQFNNNWDDSDFFDMPSDDTLEDKVIAWACNGEGSRDVPNDLIRDIIAEYE